MHVMDCGHDCICVTRGGFEGLRRLARREDAAAAHRERMRQSTNIRVRIRGSRGNNGAMATQLALVADVTPGECVDDAAREYWVGR